MATDPNQQQPPQPEQDLGRSMADLAQLVKPLASEGKLSMDAFFYLLLIWGSFHIYPLEPPPDTSGSGGGAKIIPLDNGRNIFDFGDCLSTSPGEDYGSYCTGKLITATQEMIDLLVKRGVTKVGFLGHDVARRAAWIECVEHNIAIINYEPTDFDWEVRYRIIEARKKAQTIKKPVKRLE